MPNPKTVEPVEIRFSSKAEPLAVSWSDGQVSQYPLDQLRGFCPCATCQGHQGPIEFVEGGNTELVDVAEVGNYAVRLQWADGHNTGIYSFSYLRELAGANRQQRFSRD